MPGRSASPGAAARPSTASQRPLLPAHGLLSHLCVLQTPHVPLAQETAEQGS